MVKAIVYCEIVDNDNCGLIIEFKNHTQPFAQIAH